MIKQHTLWIETISGSIHLPVWAGALVFSTLIGVVYPIVFYLVGTWNLFITTTAYFVYPLLPFVFFLVLASVYIRNTMQSLEDYATRMMAGGTPIVDKLLLISNFKIIVVVNIALNAVVDLPFFLFEQGKLTLVQNLSCEVLPWLLYLLPVATVLWVAGYSMLGIYRIGRLPMNLLPFTKDRSLGLGPFASASLRLVTLYYVYVSVQVLVDASSLGLSLFSLTKDVALILLGAVLFLLPLLSLHGKLIQAKAEESKWLSDRYTKVVQGIRSKGQSPIDESVQRELLSIDKLQKDVHSIRAWPFDTSALAKILTVVLSLTAILLSKALGPLFGLH